MKSCTRAAAFATFVVCANGAHADIVFSDTEFSPSAWGFETFTTGVGGTATPAQVGGGNPGNARQITDSVNGNGSISSMSRYGTDTATTYNPSAQGAITSIDFTIDYRFTGGAGGQGLGLQVGAKQGGVVYAAAYTITGSTGAWGTHSVVGLLASDFAVVWGGMGSLDFSATGQPIRFGFIVSNSSTGSPYTNAAAFDNFQVVIHQVPAPASAGLLAGLGGVMAMRRRRAG